MSTGTKRPVQDFATSASSRSRTLPPVSASTMLRSYKALLRSLRILLLMRLFQKLSAVKSWQIHVRRYQDHASRRYHALQRVMRERRALSRWASVCATRRLVLRAAQRAGRRPLCVALSMWRERAWKRSASHHRIELARVHLSSSAPSRAWALGKWSAASARRRELVSQAGWLRMCGMRRALSRWASQVSASQGRWALLGMLPLGEATANQHVEHLLRCTFSTWLSVSWESWLSSAAELSIVHSLQDRKVMAALCTWAHAAHVMVRHRKLPGTASGALVVMRERRALSRWA